MLVAVAVQEISDRQLVVVDSEVDLADYWHHQGLLAISYGDFSLRCIAKHSIGFRALRVFISLNLHFVLQVTLQIVGLCHQIRFVRIEERHSID